MWTKKIKYLEQIWPIRTRRVNNASFNRQTTTIRPWTWRDNNTEASVPSVEDVQCVRKFTYTM